MSAAVAEGGRRAVLRAALLEQSELLAEFQELERKRPKETQRRIIEVTRQRIRTLTARLEGLDG